MEWIRLRGSQADPARPSRKCVWVGLALGLLASGAVLTAGQLAPRAGQLPPLPLTQLDDRSLSAEIDNRAFSLAFAEPVGIRELLLLLVRGTSLSIVPDPGITGSFGGELKNVTVRQALNLILPQLGLDYSVEGTFVRVFPREPQTRLFDINYIATTRTGTSSVGADGSASFARVTTATSGDMFEDLARGLPTLLSSGAAFNVDRKAGLLQVTDFPERLERVAHYLDAIHDRVHRQVQIDARVLEVELTDPEARSLDWAALAKNAQGSGVAQSATPPRLRIPDVPKFLAALAQQGTVSTLASPRVLALNNQPAVVRASSVAPSADDEGPVREQSVTLGVTPQIASDGIVMLSLSPIVRVQSVNAAEQNAATALRETDMLARVADGETIAITGLTREQEVRERRNAGSAGGWFGRSTVVSRKRFELVILLTPRILAPLGAH